MRWLRVWPRAQRLTYESMTRLFFTTRTGSLCAYCRVMFLLESRPWRIAGAAFEVEVARRLTENESPVAELEPRPEPRVYLRDGFVVRLWTYYESVPTGDIAPSDYVQALERLHAGTRQIDVTAPHFTDRV